MQTTPFRLLTGSRETSAVSFETSVEDMESLKISAQRRPT